MKRYIWFLIQHLCLLVLISLVSCSVVDPDDMRYYDPKTKTMRVRNPPQPDENAVISPTACAEYTRYVRNHCGGLSEGMCTNAVIRGHYEEKADFLRMYLIRFINLFLRKSGVKKSQSEEILLSVKLSQSHLKILENFVNSGNDKLLIDVDAVLASQIKPYYPPVCVVDYLSKIFEAKEFFAEKPSMLIVAGILVMAAVFFYNVFVLNQIKVAIMSLFSTVFFTGYFWTYWKMYEEVMVDMMRIARHRSISVCSPQKKYFMWFFEYEVPEDVERCREYYNAHYTKPLSKLTPTLVFYETIKIFWTGALKDFADIIILMFRQLMDNSPWYIKWTVLPLVLIFTGIFIIICFAFLVGKRFKLSHPLFGAIELDADPNYQSQVSITENASSFRLLKSIDGSGSKHSCYSCGTEFVQRITQEGSVTSTTLVRVLAEKSINTDSTDGISRQGKVQSQGCTEAASSKCVSGFGTNFAVRSQENLKAGVRYVAGFIRDSVSGLQAILPQGNSPNNSSLITRVPVEVENDFLILKNDEIPSWKNHNTDILEDCPEDEVSWENRDTVTLEDCPEDDFYQEADKENKVTEFNFLPINSIRSGAKTFNRSPSKCVVIKRNLPLSTNLSSPDVPLNSGSRKKYFEEIQYIKSPDPKEMRLIPISIRNSNVHASTSRSAVETVNVGDSPRKNYFAKSNEKIKRHFSFQASTELYSSRTNNLEKTERELRNESMTPFNSTRRKLSL